MPTREGIHETNGMLELLLARPTGCISRQRCKGMGRHETHIDTRLHQWDLRNMAETSSGFQDHLGPLLDRAASLNRFLILHRLLVRWSWEDPGPTICIQDAKSPGMEESTTRSDSSWSSMKTTG